MAADVFFRRNLSTAHQLELETIVDGCRKRVFLDAATVAVLRDDRPEARARVGAGFRRRRCCHLAAQIGTDGHRWAPRL